MEYYRPPDSNLPEKKDNTLLRLVFAGCGCLVLIGVLFGLFAGRIMQTLTGPERVVKAHLQAVGRGNYLEAYSMLSARCRSRMTFQQFRDQVEPFRALLPYRDFELSSMAIKNHQAATGGKVVGRDGSIFPITYFLIREHGQWRVDRFEWVLPGELQRAGLTAKPPS